MPRQQTRTAVLAALGLAAALSLTACGGADDNASGTSGTSNASNTSSNVKSEADSGSGSGSKVNADAKPASDRHTGGGSTGRSTAKSGPGACTTANLEISAIDNTYKDEGTVTVQFINKSATCHMYGFPGVDLKTNAGTISVPRNHDKARSYDLIKGAVAAFNITFPTNDTGGSGVRPTQIVVTPPNETHSTTIAWPAGTLPASDGGDPDALVVSPVNEVM